MTTKNITGPEFKDTIHGEGITIVDVWASWCGPCMRFAPIYEKASEANPDITFAKVDTEAEQDLAGALGISSIPTLMVFRDNVLVYREAGALPARASLLLRHLLDGVRGNAEAEGQLLDRRAVGLHRTGRLVRDWLRGRCRRARLVGGAAAQHGGKEDHDGQTLHAALRIRKSES